MHDGAAFQHGGAGGVGGDFGRDGAGVFDVDGEEGAGVGADERGGVRAGVLHVSGDVVSDGVRDEGVGAVGPLCVGGPFDGVDAVLVGPRYNNVAVVLDD